LKPGDVVAADCLTYSGMKVLAEALNLELAPVPAMEDGPDLDFLEQLCRRRRIRAVYGQPTVHNPLASVMTAGRREERVSLARRHGLILIEDAPNAFLHEHAPLDHWSSWCRS
jgi:DNA-binding transcriptional MocR family regulator